METLHHAGILVKCPHCQQSFSPEEAYGHDLREQLEKEYEAKMTERAKQIADHIRKQENEKYRNHLQLLEQDRKQKMERLQEFETRVLQIQQKEMLMKQREEQMDLEMKRRLLDREKIIREQAERTAFERASLEIKEKERQLALEQEKLDLIVKKKIQEETERVRVNEQMKVMELQKKLDDQNKLIHEMKRKSEQGSMQLQGEVQELAIEDYLQNTFPRDIVEEIGKGKRGGDCVHLVKDQYGRVCGKILYESKRTKHFSYEWIPKIKEDMRMKQADLAVIVTEVLPEQATRFLQVEGIWVCTFSEFKALALLFRSNMLRVGEVLASQENKGDKMTLIYRYVTGLEFKQKLESAFECYREMQEELIKEKTMITAQWAKREKKLLKAMENIVCLYGDVRGIAGGAVQEIKALEFDSQLLNP